MDARPNVLWICADQQRFDTIGALGNPHVHTPHLDRLAADGAAFTHAYCQSPICTPSRASFLTGRYPSAVRINTNGNPHFPREETVVTRRFADAGYTCGLVGKLHLAGAYYGREPRTDDGYAFFRYSHGPRDDWPRGHDYADWLRARGEDPAKVLQPRNEGRHGVAPPTPERDNVPPQLHQTTWCAEQASTFMEQTQGPWLLSVNCYDPHPPYNPPWEYYRRFDPASLPGPYFRPEDLPHQRTLAGAYFQSDPERPEDYDGAGGRVVQALYYAMIAQVDEQVGRMLAALDRTGQRENTVILFMSDHGEALGDHGLVHKGCRFFDGLTRVPLLWSWPGHFGAGVRSDALVELTDIAPTLMELAGLPVPETMQGRSLLPILAGEADPGKHRDSVRCEYYDALHRPGQETFGTMYRDRRWKLVRYHNLGLGELYDLEADPHEFVSLWDDPAHAGMKAELLGKVLDAAVLDMDYGPRSIMPF